jgi:acyl-CoA synthetase (NDP forming)
MATDRGIPTFDEIPQAVDALKKYRDYERFLTKRRLIG